MNQDTDIKRFAAPAPDTEDERPEKLEDHDRDLDALCERWIGWCQTRKLYAPAPVPGSVLGRLSGASRPTRPGSGDAVSSAELSAFHVAYSCQPDDLAKQVFDLYYVHRVKPIKSAASALDISRKHFYDMLGRFRRRVYVAACLIQQNAAAELQLLRDRHPEKS